MRPTLIPTNMHSDVKINTHGSCEKTSIFNIYQLNVATWQYLNIRHLLDRDNDENLIIVPCC